jgi:hypothetical protein
MTVIHKPTGLDNVLKVGTIGFYGKNLLTPAVYTAHAVLGSITRDRILLRTNQKQPLTADGQFFVVGYSGSGKTIPFRDALRLSRDIGIEVPAKFTTEGIAEYLFKKHESGEKIGEYVNKPYGLIVKNEASADITANKKKDFMSGTIEILSMFHDHMLPSEYYKTAEGGVPQDPYFSVILNTVEDFIPKIDEYFWKQGICGRMLWTHIKLKKPEKKSWLDFGISKEAEDHYNIFKRYCEVLIKETDKLEKTNKRLMLTLTEGADDIREEYGYKAELEHYKAHLINFFDKEHHFLTRLDELLGKTALRIAIGRHLYEKSSLNGLTQVTEQDMEEAVKIVDISKKELYEIFTLIDISQPKNQEAISKRKRMDKIKELLKEGCTIASAVSRTNSYKYNDSDACITQLLQNAEIKLKDNKGHYEVRE